MFSAIIAVCSWITIPSAVPFTLQTLGIFLATGVLGAKWGSVSVLVYIMLGAAGLPVFSNFQGGVGALFGQTGGYIWGFLLGVLVMWLCESVFGKSDVIFAISAVSALIISYVAGTLWFAFVSTDGNADFANAFRVCVLPFVIFDLIKIIAAMYISKRIKKVSGKIF